MPHYIFFSFSSYFFRFLLYVSLFFVDKVFNGLWCLLSFWIAPFIFKILIFVSFKINKLKKMSMSTETNGLICLRFQHFQVCSERLFPTWAWRVNPSWDSLCGECGWRVMAWQGRVLWGLRTFPSSNSQRLCPLLIELFVFSCWVIHFNFNNSEKQKFSYRVTD